jgi:hypothetical protein
MIRASPAISTSFTIGKKPSRVADADAAVLSTNGYAVQWVRCEPGIYIATVERNGATTRLEWARDSDFRFFPAIADELFGYRLHIADIATNKALAAAGRREPRDVLDLLYIQGRYLPLGPVIWAAVGKDPGYSPESLISEIRRNARYRADDYADLALAEPVDAGEVARRMRRALEEAEAFAGAMPAGKEGLLFLEDGKPVQPEPEKLADYVEHAGRRGGYWPSSAEIGAMLDRDIPERQACGAWRCPCGRAACLNRSSVSRAMAAGAWSGMAKTELTLISQRT